MFRIGFGEILSVHWGDSRAWVQGPGYLLTNNAETTGEEKGI